MPNKYAVHTHTPRRVERQRYIQQLSKKSFTARFSTEGYYIGQALQGFKIRVGQITFKKRKHYIFFCLTSFSLHCIWPVRYYYSKRLVKGLLFFSFGKGLTLTTTTQAQQETGTQEPRQVVIMSIDITLIYTYVPCRSLSSTVKSNFFERLPNDCTLPDYSAQSCQLVFLQLHIRLLRDDRVGIVFFFQLVFTTS